MQGRRSSHTEMVLIFHLDKAHGLFFRGNKIELGNTAIPLPSENPVKTDNHIDDRKRF